MSNVENSVGLFDSKDFKNTGIGYDCMCKAENYENAGICKIGCLIHKNRKNNRNPKRHGQIKVKSYEKIRWEVNIMLFLAFVSLFVHRNVKKRLSGL